MANRSPFLLWSLMLAAWSCIIPAAHSQSVPEARVTANVELVQVPVIVFDAKGAVATDLVKDDFRITEDGVEQRILHLDKEREPVSFVILADVSQSMTKKIPFVQAATQSVVVPVDDEYKQKVRDEFSLFSFESRVRLLVPFTEDEADLERRVPALLEPTKGGTALLDAVYAGTNEARSQAQNHRRAVIIISDGGDNHSRYSLRKTREFLEEAGVPVFAVMAGPLFQLSDLLPPLPIPRKTSRFPIQLPDPAANYIGEAERHGPETLKSLTEVTGGGVFTAQNLDALPRIVQTIGFAVRYEYLLSYAPHGTEDIKHENNWHRIRLELAPQEKFQKYSARYKRGYFKIDRVG